MIYDNNAPNIVYVASAFRGDVALNTERATKFSRFVAAQGKTPFTPHLLYPQFLNDAVPKERKQGLAFGLAVLAKCDELWSFGGISEGMKAEIESAKRLGIPVRYFNEDCEGVQI